jgi:hypothetical protein
VKNKIPTILSLLILLSIGLAHAQTVPMKIADEYKNKYEFEDALQWYEKVIQDFPDTLEAGNAILNKLAILYSQISWYTQLSEEFLTLVNAQYDAASTYGCRGTMWKKYGEFKEKKKTYERLRLQKGSVLKEELYRFENHYTSHFHHLSIPHINKYTGKMPSLRPAEEIERLLVLGNESYLEYESRRKRHVASNFRLFCLQYLTLGGKQPTTEDIAAYHNQEYDKIDSIGFYYCLGLGLENGYQFQSAYEFFATVVKLAEELPTQENKLADEVEKRMKRLEDISSTNIDSLRKFLEPAEIDEYVEPYTEEK